MCHAGCPASFRKLPCLCLPPPPEGSLRLQTLVLQCVDLNSGHLARTVCSLNLSPALRPGFAEFHPQSRAPAGLTSRDSPPTCPLSFCGCMYVEPCGFIGPQLQLSSSVYACRFRGRPQCHPSGLCTLSFGDRVSRWPRAHRLS